MSQRGFAPLTSPTLGESVAEAIRGAILMGRFAPSERLVEAELARELNVSRGPIREALGLLANDGIVTHVPRRGKFVQSLSPRLIDEVYSLRRVLEPYAAELVIEKLDDARKERLRAALAEIAAAVAMNDAALTARRDIAFHKSLFDLADHELLHRAWLENIEGRLRILLNVTQQSLHTLGDAERQHRSLLTPILARDAAAARRRIEAHIDDAWHRAKVDVAKMKPDVENRVVFSRAGRVRRPRRRTKRSHRG